MKINKIYNGDSFDLLKELPDNSVDLLLLDPPYSIHNTSIDNEIDLNAMWVSEK